MSGLEIIGIVASIAQIADLGAKLSVKLFTVSRTIKGAQRSIQGISEEIAVTSTVLSQLGTELKKDVQGDLYSAEAITTTKGIMAGCRDIFKQLERAISTDGPGAPGGGPSATLTDLKKRLKFTFMESQIDGLRSKLERFKSSLLVMLNLLIFAGQIRSHESLESLKEQKALLQGLASSDSASSLREPIQEHALDDSKAGSQRFLPSTGGSAAELKAYTSKSPFSPALTTSPLETTTSRGESLDPLENNAWRASGHNRKDTTMSPANSNLDELEEDIEEDRERPRGVGRAYRVGPPIDKFIFNPSSRRFDRNVLSLYRKDLEQHAALVNTLVAEVSSPAHVDLDLGIRDRVEKGLLDQHLEEWSTLLKKVGLGLDPFLPVLEKYPRLVGRCILSFPHLFVDLENFWRRMEFEAISDELVIDEGESDTPRDDAPERIVMRERRYEMSLDEMNVDEMNVDEAPPPPGLPPEEEDLAHKVRDGSMKSGSSSEYVEEIRRQRKEEKTKNAISIDLSRPTYIRVNRKYLHPDTLDAFGLPWEWDKHNDEYIIITKYIDLDLQEELFEHTRRLKERKLITGPYIKETETITTLAPDEGYIKKRDKMYAVRRKSEGLDDRESDSLDDLLKRFTNLSEEERKSLPSYPAEEHSSRRRSWMFT